jgi:hypothetical protein
MEKMVKRVEKNLKEAQYGQKSYLNLKKRD